MIMINSVLKSLERRNCRFNNIPEAGCFRQIFGILVK